MQIRHAAISCGLIALITQIKSTIILSRSRSTQLRTATNLKHIYLPINARSTHTIPKFHKSLYLSLYQHIYCILLHLKFLPQLLWSKQELKNDKKKSRDGKQKATSCITQSKNINPHKNTTNKFIKDRGFHSHTPFLSKKNILVHKQCSKHHIVMLKYKA